MTPRWHAGFQLAEPGAPITAACSGSAPRRFLARMPAPRVIRSRAISGVVTEPRSLQRGVAFVDLGETLGEEELVTSRQPGRRQRRCRVEKVHSGLVVKVRDRYQQPREVHCASHGDCFLPCDRMTLCVRTAGRGRPGRLPRSSHAHRCARSASVAGWGTAIDRPHRVGVISSPPVNALRDQGLCGVDMSPRSVPAWQEKPKSGINKGICAGYGGDTARDNYVSTPRPRGPISYREYTPKAALDNRRSARVSGYWFCG